MNWKEHNGKFKAQIGRDAKYIDTFQPYMNKTDGNYYHNGFGMDECTLIARKISDMTDGEREIWKSFFREKSGRMITVYEKQRDYLLSIRVYPFDHAAFETGDVIDSTTL